MGRDGVRGGVLAGAAPEDGGAGAAANQDFLPCGHGHIRAEDDAEDDEGGPKGRERGLVGGGWARRGALRREERGGEGGERWEEAGGGRLEGGRG